MAVGNQIEANATRNGSGMAIDDGGRANWKDPEIVKLFLDLCLEEVNTGRCGGGSLKRDSWTKISKILNEKKNINFNQKQLKNQWDYLKKKYGVWSKIVGKTGHGYNPVTNIVNWSAEQWDDYIKAVPEAKQFRYVGLQYADEMKSLFDGITATEQGAWCPSKEGMPTDTVGSSSSFQPVTGISQIHIDLESQSPPTPSSPKDVSLPKEKHRRKSMSGDLDGHLIAILKTLEKSDGPSLEDCNRNLNEMEMLQMNNPLYVAACTIFCESKAHREQWMMLTHKPEEVRITWIEMNARKLGLL